MSGVADELRVGDPVSGLDPARREELAEAIGDLIGRDVSAKYADALAPLIGRWLAEARAEGAAEVRARVEAVLTDAPHVNCPDACKCWQRRVRAALADPTKETP